MSVDGLQTCPHCRALVQSHRCSICGRSTTDPVDVPTATPAVHGSDGALRRELRKVGVGLLVIVGVSAAAAFVLTRPNAAPSATALPPPVSTTTVEPRPTTSEPPPSLVGGARPTTGFVPGVPREVPAELSPWDSAPPVDLVTGRLLDETIDYGVDIARVADLLAAVPAAYSLAPLDPPELTTFGGRLDADRLEATQPFAARTLRGPDDAALGSLWLIASGGSATGDAYLAAARARWGVDAAVDRFAPEVGLRVWLLGSDATDNLWGGDLFEDSMVLVRAPVAVDPVLLTDLLDAWRRDGA